MKKLLIFGVLIAAFSCSKQEKTFLNSTDFMAEYPNWVNSEDDIFIFISSKLGSEILMQKNYNYAIKKANYLENKDGLEKGEYIKSILDNFDVTENELFDYFNLLSSSNLYFNKDHLNELEKRYNLLVDSGDIESLDEFKNNLNRCTLGEAIWSVLSGTGTLIACGGAVVTCIPTAGVTCVGCAISAAGTYQAMLCWF